MIQVYTGNGKGKTTAALGLALRACGAGMRVYIAQFAKGRNTSEINSLRKLPRVKLEQFGCGCFIRKKPTPKQAELARQGFARIVENARKGSYDLMVIDEILVALNLGLLELAKVTAFLNDFSGKCELILTGRNCPKEIVKLADLVSEVKEIKHYYKKGIPARKGIEF